MVNDKDLRLLAQKRLRTYLQNFDAENRGNRLSRELIAGLYNFLEDLVVGVCHEIEKGETNNEHIESAQNESCTTDLLSTTITNRN